MRNITRLHPAGRWLPGFPVIRHAGLLIAVLAAGVCHGQLTDKMIVESEAATPVTEAVRAAAPGTLVRVLVKTGDAVKKGQLLGHTELANTKFQLDLARQTLENNASLMAMEAQANAWTASREETEEAVRRRQADRTRLDWATGMEKFHRSNYEAQVEQKKIQRIQYEYWKEQYEARFLRAPVEGVVTEVLVELGKQIGYAQHIFTIGNDHAYTIPVSVPAAVASGISTQSTLPVRSSKGRHLARAMVDSVMDDPASPGRKIIRLLLNERDFPATARASLPGMTFDVLMPQGDAEANPDGAVDSDARATASR
jgi:biotin carboxyl carrier protein